MATQIINNILHLRRWISSFCWLCTSDPLFLWGFARHHGCNRMALLLTEKSPSSAAQGKTRRDRALLSKSGRSYRKPPSGLRALKHGGHHPALLSKVPYKSLPGFSPNKLLPCPCKPQRSPTETRALARPATVFHPAFRA